MTPMTRMMRCAAAVLVLLLGAVGAARGQTIPGETPAQRDERMRWWREAKFGLFIHWGVYAVPAGTYDGKQIGGIGEWIMRNGKIPVAQYKAYARQFNPVKYDPKAWATLAREAGMKYVVITSKHHDGFALWDSKVSQWDIADATPYGKDLLTPLARAARGEGLRFGLYYSQAQDWTHPGGAKAGLKDGEGWDEAHKGSFDAYLKDIAVPQVGEILTQFKPDILWWDTPVLMNKERADPFLPLVARHPAIITNNRLGGPYRGDTDTPEQHIPATGIPGRDWEVCMTMNDTWGFKSYDHNWKSTEDLLQKLSDIVSKGGNFLLNVGPTAEGEIPQPSIERLKEVGRWMKVNGEAIYGTTASPFSRLPWGRCTTKLKADGATLYLHVFDWPTNGRLVVPGLKSKVKTARLLAARNRLEVEAGADGVVLTVPDKAPDPHVSVIRLEVEGPLDVARILPRQAADGALTLTAANADIHNQLGTDTKVEEKDGKQNVGYWTDARATVSWVFDLQKPGEFDVYAELAAPQAGSQFHVQVGATRILTTAPSTGDYAKFESVHLGRLTIARAGEHELYLRPVGGQWKPINLRTLTLRPAR
jgi:alpha-L-fucosidase